MRVQCRGEEVNLYKGGGDVGAVLGVTVSRGVN